MKREQPRCRYCGSPNVSLDATAVWNADNQDWELSQTYDNGFCHDCDSECKHFDWEEIQ